MSINDDLSRLDDLISVRKRVTLGDHAALERVKAEIGMLKTQRDGYAVEISRLEQEREWWTAVNNELLPYQERAVAAEEKLADRDRDAFNYSQRLQGVEAKLARFTDGLREPLQLLNGIDYEEQSRIGRAVAALEGLAEDGAARLRPDWKDYLESRTEPLADDGTAR